MAPECIQTLIRGLSCLCFSSVKSKSPFYFHSDKKISQTDYVITSFLTDVKCLLKMQEGSLTDDSYYVFIKCKVLKNKKLIIFIALCSPFYPLKGADLIYYLSFI